jgi:hypothetical protein
VFSALLDDSECLPNCPKDELEQQRLASAVASVPRRVPRANAERREGITQLAPLTERNMSDLEILFRQNREWADRLKATRADFFESLAGAQSPQYLWIGLRR